MPERRPGRVEWIGDRARFEQVADAWDALASTTGSPFLLHAWLSAWWDAFGAGSELRVCALWDGDELIAALPLARTGRRRLESLANSHSPEFFPVARDRPALDELMAAVLAECAELTLRAVPGGHAVLESLAAARRRSVVVEPAPLVQRIELRGDYASYAAATKWRRTEAPRRLRRARRDHDIAFSLVAPPVDLAGELESGLQLEASGWKGASGTAILSSPDTERFYRSIAEEFARRGELRFSSLTIDGELAAWRLALLHAGRLHDLKHGFDERFRSVGSGILLIAADVERCYELGLDAYELGPGEQRYKHVFGNTTREHLTVHCHRLSPSTAHRIVYWRYARPVLRRAYRRLRGRPALP